MERLQKARHAQFSTARASSYLNLQSSVQTRVSGPCTLVHLIPTDEEQVLSSHFTLEETEAEGEEEPAHSTCLESRLLKT